jgi:hypothetical protein
MELVLWDAPRVGEGLEEKLVQWIDGHSNARLIAIDILEKIRPRRTRNVYEDDYRALASLQRLAQERDIAVMVVHHERKGKADDFRDLISGAMSLAGAADTLWVLKRTAGEAEATLHITGRDVDTKELAMQFADGFWTALGDAGAVPRNAAHQAILEALTVSEQPLTSRMLAALLGVNHHTAKSHLTRLRKRGFVRQSDRGGYIPGSNHRMRRGE